ncbi:MAG: ABC transporter ATP-binding protein [Mycoplasmatales bacterium]
MIKLTNIQKSYQGRAERFHALKGINLEIKKGEYIAIVGSSGCGKTTLLKIIGLLDNKYSGQYYFNNEEISTYVDKKLTSFRAANIGFVFQDFQLIQRLNVYQNIEIALVVSKQKTSKEKIMSVLKQVGLEDKSNSYPDELSGGQKQRVSIARALVKEPSIIIADEPTGALDEDTSLEILKLFDQINKLGKTIIVVTHDENVAKNAERIVTIKRGVAYDN